MTEKFKETFIGSIPQEWDTDKLENLCKIITDGSHFSPKEYTGENGKIIATVKNMDDFGFNINSCKRICVKDYETLVKNGCKPEKGDVLFSKDGTIGLTFVYDDEIELVLLSSIAILKVNDRINPYFLKYYLQDKKTQDLIKSGHTSGSALPRIVLKDLKLLEVVVPPINEQELIIKHLLALDQKIELNQKMNQTLEKIGQAIFKHWFMDFEFPDEDGRPYKSGGGEMVDSELGDIPKGWKIVKVGDLIELIYGKGLTKNKRNPGEIPVYGSNGITDYHNEAFVNGPGLIIGRKGTVGKIHISYGDFWPIDTTYFVKSKIDSIMIFWYYLLNSLNLDKMNVHSAVPGLNRNDVYEILIAIPNDNLFYKIEEILKSLHDKIDQNDKQSENLSQIRDSLLPKLMSGKIRLNKPINSNQELSKELEA
ncbi:MAG: restriction endonuclease subunit S [Methanobacterium sp.]|nr:restriction endonuclease subunit S [Methanobacterium sp.]